MEEDLLSVIIKDIKVHIMYKSFCNTNPNFCSLVLLEGEMELSIFLKYNNPKTLL